MLKLSQTDVGNIVNVAVYTVLTKGAEKVLQHLRNKGVKEEEIKSMVEKANEFVQEMFDDG